MKGGMSILYVATFGDEALAESRADWLPAPVPAPRGGHPACWPIKHGKQAADTSPRPAARHRRRRAAPRREHRAHRTGRPEDHQYR
jgi:hypothetical protein